MQVPFQLTFRGMPHSDGLAAHVQLRVQALEQLYDRIISCHVVVEPDGHSHRSGERFRVSINLGVAGHEILVGHLPSDSHRLETAHEAADRAFDDAGRELLDWVKRQRSVRRHAQTTGAR